MDEKNKVAKVKAPEDQLSLAIGKEGQNVRLCAKLTGYRIEVEPSSAEATEGQGELEKVEKKEAVIEDTGAGAKRKIKPKRTKKSKPAKAKKPVKAKEVEEEKTEDGSKKLDAGK